MPPKGKAAQKLKEPEGTPFSTCGSSCLSWLSCRVVPLPSSPARVALLTGLSAFCSKESSACADSPAAKNDQRAEPAALPADAAVRQNPRSGRSERAVGGRASRVGKLQLRARVAV